MNDIKELGDSLTKMFGEIPVSYSEMFELSGSNFVRGLQTWLREKHKVIVLPSAMIDPKYNNRVLYSITLLEWSRSHEFYMDKSSNGYYDTYEEALLKGLLQGLEIVKIKVYGITGQEGSI